MNRSNTYAIHIQGGIATVEWFVFPSFSDIRHALVDVIRHKDYRRGMALLIIDRAEHFNSNQRMIGMGIRRLARYAEYFDRHMAFVFEKETHLEVGRLCATRAESCGIILMLFREVNTARQWLLAHLSDSDSFPAPCV